MYSLKKLENCNEMQVYEWTEDFDVYDAKTAFFSLLDYLQLKLIAVKDDYGNINYKYEKIVEEK